MAEWGSDHYTDGALMTQSQSGDPDEAAERNDVDLTELLNEVRLLWPGTALIVAFLLTLPFNTGYTRVSPVDNVVYVVMFLCTMTSFVLFMAPAAQHRLMRPLKNRAAFKRSANRLIIIGLVPLSVTMPLMTYFVVSDVVGRAAAAIVAGAIGLLVAGLWWIIPVRGRG
jgi:hypothetical protein